MTGQPLPRGFRGGVGQVLQERSRRPVTDPLVGQHQGRGVLLQDGQPCRRRAGAEKEYDVARGSAQPVSSRAYPAPGLLSAASSRTQAARPGSGNSRASSSTSR